jgi:hypothetical protein
VPFVRPVTGAEVLDDTPSVNVFTSEAKVEEVEN